jgi:glycosyltransferase involved in cell wall biosynthesis
MKQKLVSVCIPTYNSANFIEETLRSIIAQSYENIEIIIGDNASIDNTYEIIRKFSEKDLRIKYYRNEFNLGYSSNCNKLISMANGEYIAIYHADDIYDLNIIKQQVELLDKNKELLGVFTSYDKINENGEVFKEISYPIISDEEVIEINLDKFINVVLEKGGSCFCCPTSMIRKSIYLKLKGYDQNLKYIEDQDMWARILLNGPMAIINLKLIKYRIHTKQSSLIYINTDRDELSLPLKHINDFLLNNKLYILYKAKLLRAQAFDYIHLAKLSAFRQNYPEFHKNICHSRQLSNLGLNSRTGLVQNWPFPILTYFIVITLKNVLPKSKPI